ncbi:MAG: SUMF1/EgtB/PvdO family nonheme iron enzyme [Anaerolineales bacterium]
MKIDIICRISTHLSFEGLGMGKIIHKRITLVLIVFLLVSACAPQGGSETPTPVGGTPVGATAVGATPIGATAVGATAVGATPVGATAVGPTSVGPTPVASGFTNVNSSFAQLSDGSTVIQFKGGDVKNADGSTTTLDPFWISSSPITNQQYELCVAAGICTPPDGKDNPGFLVSAGDVFPVTGVTSQQAQAYCTWQGGSLPTSAQSKQADEGTLQFLEFLFAVHTEGFTYLPLGSGNEHEATACDFMPAGTAGCSESQNDTISPCDLVPAGTEGCSPDEPPLSACDLVPPGTAGCPADSTDGQATACDFVPAGTGGCPPKESEADVQACDLLPGGCPSDDLQACDLLPGGCPSGSSDTLSNLLVGLLSGPNTSLYGYFSDDTSSGGKTTYTSPVGKVITVDANVHGDDISFKCVIPNPKIYAPYCQSAAYVPSTKGNYPSPACQNVTIDPVGTYCTNKIPYVNVNVSAGSDLVWTDPSSANCSTDPANSTSSNDRFICTGPEANPITIYSQTQCSAPADWNPQKTCLEGYTYDAASNMCTYTGSQADSQSCPAGFTYSSDVKCCVASSNYQPVCAPGFYNSPLGCVQYANTYLTVQSSVNIPVCQNTDSGGGGGSEAGSSCNITCGAGQQLDVASCSCNPVKP